jgi:hypothetical protein
MSDSQNICCMQRGPGGVRILDVLPIFEYSSAPVSVGDTLQDLPRLREMADNTECYI